MPKFGGGISDMTTAASVDGAMGWTSVAGESGEFVEFIMTGSGITAAADTQHRATVDYSEGTGSIAGTAQTAQKFDQNSAVGKLELEVTILTEGTTIQTPPAVDFGFNQRGGMRWAVPRGEGVYLTFDNANEDLEFRAISSAAGKISASANWWEP